MKTSETAAKKKPRFKKEEQSEPLNIRITPTELRMLNMLSKQLGLSTASVIRQALRHEYFSVAK